MIVSNHHFFFFCISLRVTSFELVLMPVVNTFLVYSLLILAKPCVLPPPLFPFFLYPFLCHFGYHLSGSPLKFSTILSMFFGRRALLFFFILFLLLSSFLI